MPQKDAITRVAYMVKMYRRSILNHFAFKEYFSDGTRCGKSKKEKQAFTCYRDISKDDWTLVIEIEAVLHSCAQYALGVTKNNAMITFPFTLYFRSFLKKCLEAPSFECLTISFKPDVALNEFTQPREVKLKSEFSKEGLVCIERWLAQLTLRFPPQKLAEYAKGMIMDPRTKSWASVFMDKRIEGGADL